MFLILGRFGKEKPTYKIDSMKWMILPILAILPFKGFSSRDTLRGSVNVGINLSDGNLKVHNLSFGGELKGVSEHRDWSINPGYRYLETFSYPITPTSKPVRQNEFYISSNLSYRIGDRMKIIFFSEEEHSEIRRIQWRANIGVGPAYKFIKNATTVFDLSCVALPDYYLSIQSSGDPYKKDNLSMRLSVRAKFSWNKDPITINSVQVFQPSLRTWTEDPTEYVPWSDNINVRSINTMDIKVSGRINMGIQFDLIYQSYLGYIASQPAFIAKSLYLSPYDYNFTFFIKYKKD